MTTDRVTSELRWAVFERDKGCFLVRLDPGHVCYDQWGNPHAPDRLEKLTLEHVHDGYGMMGRRAPSDARHMVALCFSANIGVPSKATRAAMRAYLREVAA